MSSAIAKLRETGELANLERAWFQSKWFLLSEDSSKDPNALTLGTFRGLFIISGITSSLAIVLFFLFYLRENWYFVRNYKLERLRQVLQITSVTKYLHNNRIHNGNINHAETNSVWCLTIYAEYQWVVPLLYTYICI